ncbi:MAG: hypothetical protein RLZZ360_242 [Candidatus Parcubacteria bacterium]|jgi:hypothetical protein
MGNIDSIEEGTESERIGKAVESLTELLADKYDAYAMSDFREYIPVDQLETIVRKGKQALNMFNEQEVATMVEQTLLLFACR